MQHMFLLTVLITSLKSNLICRRRSNEMKSKFKRIDRPECSKSYNALALNELIIIVLWRPFSLEIRRITCRESRDA